MTIIIISILIVCFFWFISSEDGIKTLSLLYQWINWTPPKRIAPIYFCYIENDAIFRFQKDWWMKSSHKTAISSKGIEKTIESLDIVGALLDCLPYDHYKYILSND